MNIWRMLDLRSALGRPQEGRLTALYMRASAREHDMSTKSESSVKKAESFGGLVQAG